MLVLRLSPRCYQQHSNLVIGALQKFIKRVMGSFFLDFILKNLSLDDNLEKNPCL